MPQPRWGGFTGAGEQVIGRSRDRMTDGRKEPWSQPQNRAPAVIPSASFFNGERRLNGGASWISRGRGRERSRQQRSVREKVEEIGGGACRDETSTGWLLQVVLDVWLAGI
jgi:hypothetical protein